MKGTQLRRREAQMKIEKLDGRCIECNRPLYWNEKQGSVHFNGVKYPCPKKNGGKDV